MSRPRWPLFPDLLPDLIAVFPALVLSASLCAVAGCKDSKPDYIGFDASNSDVPSAEVKSDAPAADSGPGDAPRSDASLDAAASDGSSADTVAEAVDGGPDAAPTDGVSDVETDQ